MGLWKLISPEDCPAKCKIRSKFLGIFEIEDDSIKLIFKNSTSLGMFSSFPPDKLSIPTTLWPSDINLFATRDPINPATPVIRTFLLI